MNDYDEIQEQLDDAYSRLEETDENDVDALSAIYAEISELEYAKFDG